MPLTAPTLLSPSHSAPLTILDTWDLTTDYPDTDLTIRWKVTKILALGAVAWLREYCGVVHADQPLERAPDLPRVLHLAAPEAVWRQLACLIEDAGDEEKLVVRNDRWTLAVAQNKER